MKVSGVILAGGKSKRLGRDKALVEIGGKPLIVRVIESLEQLTTEILVVTAADHPLELLKEVEDVRVVNDLLPGKGALGGVYTGLKSTENTYNIVVGCDMPFLNLNLLKHMVESCDGYDVVIPKFDGYLEPLHAVYSKNCLPAIERLLQQGELRVLSFFPYVRVRYLEEAEIDLFDPRRASFLNINTEEDMRRAIEIERGS